MLLGAFGAYYTVLETDNHWLGVLVGIAIGLFMGLVYAVVTERRESRLDKSLIEMKRRVKKTWKGEQGLRVGEINPY